MLILQIIIGTYFTLFLLWCYKQYVLIYSFYRFIKLKLGIKYDNFYNRKLILYYLLVYYSKKFNKIIIKGKWKLKSLYTKEK